MISLDKVLVTVVDPSELPEGVDVQMGFVSMRCTQPAYDALTNAIDEHNAAEASVGHAVPFEGLKKAGEKWGIRFHEMLGVLR